MNNLQVNLNMSSVLTRILFEGVKGPITLKFRGHPEILVGHLQKVEIEVFSFTIVFACITVLYSLDGLYPTQQF